MPELVTVSRKVTVWPTAVTDAGVADFTSVRAGVALTVTVSVTGAETTGVPPPKLVSALASFSTSPASTSAWVTV